MEACPVEEYMIILMVLLKDFRPFCGRLGGNVRQVEFPAVVK
jgi:hypothetical protein